MGGSLSLPSAGSEPCKLAWICARGRLSRSMLDNLLSLSLQVRWMMYWIVFALFMAMETLTDMFVSW